ncbi:uncharacterized protein LOC143279539 [Babylonia areolata]|uniref:uncharacterized protein LOC143279539 n=1 Tax=Babylonia areolata TaxID=304850 RepID=UPI003FD20CD2
MVETEKGTAQKGLSFEVQKLLANKYVMILGDSNHRGVYKDLVLLLQKNEMLSQHELRSKGELTFRNDTLVEGGVKGELCNGVSYTEQREYQTPSHLVQFNFITRCYNQYIESILQKISTGPAPDLLVMNSCLWDLTRYGRNPMKQYKDKMTKLCGRLVQVLGPDTLFVWTTTLPISKKAHGGFLTPDVVYKSQMLTREVLEANFQARNIVVDHGFKVLDLHCWFRNKLELRTQDGVHWCSVGHRFLSKLLLTSVAHCWGVPFPPMPYLPSHHRVKAEKQMPSQLKSLMASAGQVERHGQKLLQATTLPYKRPAPYCVPSVFQEKLFCCDFFMLATNNCNTPVQFTALSNYLRTEPSVQSTVPVPLIQNSTLKPPSTFASLPSQKAAPSGLSTQTVTSKRLGMTTVTVKREPLSLTSKQSNKAASNSETMNWPTQTLQSCSERAVTIKSEPLSLNLKPSNSETFTQNAPASKPPNGKTPTSESSDQSTWVSKSSGENGQTCPSSSTNAKSSTGSAQQEKPNPPKRKTEKRKAQRTIKTEVICDRWSTCNRGAPFQNVRSLLAVGPAHQNSWWPSSFQGGRGRTNGGERFWSYGFNEQCSGQQGMNEMYCQNNPHFGHQYTKQYNQYHGNQHYPGNPIHRNYQCSFNQHHQFPVNQYNQHPFNNAGNWPNTWNIKQKNFKGFTMPQTPAPSEFFNSWAEYSNDNFIGPQRHPYVARRAGGYCGY